MAALEVVKMTTSSAVSDENFIKMTTFPFQWSHEPLIILPVLVLKPFTSSRHQKPWFCLCIQTAEMGWICVHNFVKRTPNDLIHWFFLSFLLVVDPNAIMTTEVPQGKTFVSRDVGPFHNSTTMEPCVVWKFPSPPIGSPDCRDVMIEKPCVVGAQPTGNYAN